MLMIRRLEQREKYLVFFVACSIAIYFLLQFIIFPFFEKREHVERAIRTKEQALKEIVMLRAEHQAYKKRAQETQKALSNRKEGFTLFSFLERAAAKAGVKDYIKYMKPSVFQDTGPHKKSMVEIKLEKITLKQLMGYLYRIELPENAVSIENISIRENKRETGHLDAVLKVLTIH